MISGLLLSLLVPTAVGGGVGIFFGVLGKALTVKKSVSRLGPLLQRIKPDITPKELDELEKGWAQMNGPW